MSSDDPYGEDTFPDEETVHAAPMPSIRPSSGGRLQPAALSPAAAAAVTAELAASAAAAELASTAAASSSAAGDDSDEEVAELSPVPRPAFSFSAASASVAAAAQELGPSLQAQAAAEAERARAEEAAEASYAAASAAQALREAKDAVRRPSLFAPIKEEDEEAAIRLQALARGNIVRKRVGSFSAAARTSPGLGAMQHQSQQSPSPHNKEHSSPSPRSSPFPANSSPHKRGSASQSQGALLPRSVVEELEQTEAATKIQAIARGRAVRKQQAASSTAAEPAPTASSVAAATEPARTAAPVTTPAVPAAAAATATAAPVADSVPAPQPTPAAPAPAAAPATAPTGSPAPVAASQAVASPVPAAASAPAAAPASAPAPAPATVPVAPPPSAAAATAPVAATTSVPASAPASAPAPAPAVASEPTAAPAPAVTAAPAPAQAAAPTPAPAPAPAPVLEGAPTPAPASAPAVAPALDAAPVSDSASASSSNSAPHPHRRWFIVSCIARVLRCTARALVQEAEASDVAAAKASSLAASGHHRVPTATTASTAPVAAAFIKHERRDLLARLVSTVGGQAEFEGGLLMLLQTEELTIGAPGPIQAHAFYLWACMLHAAAQLSGFVAPDSQYPLARIGSDASNALAQMDSLFPAPWSWARVPTAAAATSASSKGAAASTAAKAPAALMHLALHAALSPSSCADQLHLSWIVLCNLAAFPSNHPALLYWLTQPAVNPTTSVSGGTAAAAAETYWELLAARALKAQPAAAAASTSPAADPRDVQLPRCIALFLANLLSTPATATKVAPTRYLDVLRHFSGLAAAVPAAAASSPDTLLVAPVLSVLLSLTGLSEAIVTQWFRFDSLWSNLYAIAQAGAEALDISVTHQLVRLCLGVASYPSGKTVHWSDLSLMYPFLCGCIVRHEPLAASSPLSARIVSNTSACLMQTLCDSPAAAATMAARTAALDRVASVSRVENPDVVAAEQKAQEAAASTRSKRWSVYFLNPAAGPALSALLRTMDAPTRLRGVALANHLMALRGFAAHRPMVDSWLTAENRTSLCVEAAVAICDDPATSALELLPAATMLLVMFQLLHEHSLTLPKPEQQQQRPEYIGKLLSLSVLNVLLRLSVRLDDTLAVARAAAAASSAASGSSAAAAAEKAVPGSTYPRRLALPSAPPANAPPTVVSAAEQDANMWLSILGLSCVRLLLMTHTAFDELFATGGTQVATSLAAMLMQVLSRDDDSFAANIPRGRLALPNGGTPSGRAKFRSRHALALAALHGMVKEVATIGPEGPQMLLDEADEHRPGVLALRVALVDAGALGQLLAMAVAPAMPPLIPNTVSLDPRIVVRMAGQLIASWTHVPAVVRALRSICPAALELIVAKPITSFQSVSALQTTADPLKSSPALTKLRRDTLAHRFHYVMRYLASLAASDVAVLSADPSAQKPTPTIVADYESLAHHDLAMSFCSELLVRGGGGAGVAGQQLLPPLMRAMLLVRLSGTAAYEVQQMRARVHKHPFEANHQALLFQAMPDQALGIILQLASSAPAAHPMLLLALCNLFATPEDDPVAVTVAAREPEPKKSTDAAAPADQKESDEAKQDDAAAASAAAASAVAVSAAAAAPLVSAASSRPAGVDYFRANFASCVLMVRPPEPLAPKRKKIGTASAHGAAVSAAPPSTLPSLQPPQPVAEALFATLLHLLDHAPKQLSHPLLMGLLRVFGRVLACCNDKGVYFSALDLGHPSRPMAGGSDAAASRPGANPFFSETLTTDRFALMLRKLMLLFVGEGPQQPEVRVAVLRLLRDLSARPSLHPLLCASGSSWHCSLLRSLQHGDAKPNVLPLAVAQATDEYELVLQVLINLFQNKDNLAQALRAEQEQRATAAAGAIPESGSDAVSVKPARTSAAGALSILSLAEIKTTLYAFLVSLCCPCKPADAAADAGQAVAVAAQPDPSSIVRLQQLSLELLLVVEGEIALPEGAAIERDETAIQACAAQSCNSMLLLLGAFPLLSKDPQCSVLLSLLLLKTLADRHMRFIPFSADGLPSADALNPTEAEAQNLVAVAEKLVHTAAGWVAAAQHANHEAQARQHTADKDAETVDGYEMPSPSAEEEAAAETESVNMAHLQQLSRHGFLLLITFMQRVPELGALSASLHAALLSFLFGQLSDAQSSLPDLLLLLKCLDKLLSQTSATTLDTSLVYKSTHLFRLLDLDLFHAPTPDGQGPGEAQRQEDALLLLVTQILTRFTSRIRRALLDKGLVDDPPAAASASSAAQRRQLTLSSADAESLIAFSALDLQTQVLPAYGWLIRTWGDRAALLESAQNSVHAMLKSRKDESTQSAVAAAEIDGPPATALAEALGIEFHAARAAQTQFMLELLSILEACRKRTGVEAVDVVPLLSLIRSIVMQAWEMKYDALHATHTALAAAVAHESASSAATTRPPSGNSLLKSLRSAPSRPTGPEIEAIEAEIESIMRVNTVYDSLLLMLTSASTCSLEVSQKVAQYFALFLSAASASMTSVGGAAAIGGATLLSRMDRMGFFSCVLRDGWWAASSAKAAAPISASILTIMRVLVQHSNGSLVVKQRSTDAATMVAEAAPNPRVPEYLYTESLLQTLLLVLFSPKLYPRSWRADALLILRGMSTAIVGWNARLANGGATPPRRSASVMDEERLRVAGLVEANKRRRAAMQRKSPSKTAAATTGDGESKEQLIPDDLSSAAVAEDYDDIDDEVTGPMLVDPPIEGGAGSADDDDAEADAERAFRVGELKRANGGQPFSTEVVLEVLKTWLFELAPESSGGGSHSSSSSDEVKEEGEEEAAASVAAAEEKPTFAPTRKALHLSLHGVFTPTESLEALRSFLRLLHSQCGAAQTILYTPAAPLSIGASATSMLSPIASTAGGRKACAHYMLSQRIEHVLMGVWERNLQLRASKRGGAGSSSESSLLDDSDPDDLSKPIFDLLLFFSQFSASLQEHLTAEAARKQKERDAQRKAERAAAVAAAVKERELSQQSTPLHSPSRGTRTPPVSRPLVVVKEIAELPSGAHVLNPELLLAKQYELEDAQEAAAADEAAIRAAITSPSAAATAAIADQAGPPCLPFASSLLLCFHPSRPSSLALLHSFSHHLQRTVRRSSVLRGVLWKHEWFGIMLVLFQISSSFFAPSNSASAKKKGNTDAMLKDPSAVPACELKIDPASLSFVCLPTAYLSSYAAPGLPASRSVPHSLFLSVLDCIATMLSDEAIFDSFRVRARRDLQAEDESAREATRKAHALIFEGKAAAGAEFVMPPADLAAEAAEAQAAGGSPSNPTSAPLRALNILAAWKRAHEVAASKGAGPADATAVECPSSAVLFDLASQLESEGAVLEAQHEVNLISNYKAAEAALQAHKKRMRLLPALQRAQSQAGMNPGMMAGGASVWK